MNAGPFEISQVILGENLEELAKLPDGSFQMIYIDPPFNTGRDQSRRTMRTVADADGDRTGFEGRRYRTELLQKSSYRDSFPPW